jgi:hypothetical protein
MSRKKYENFTTKFCLHANFIRQLRYVELGQNQAQNQAKLKYIHILIFYHIFFITLFCVVNQY